MYLCFTIEETDTSVLICLANVILFPRNGPCFLYSEEKKTEKLRDKWEERKLEKGVDWSSKSCYFNIIKINILLK